MRTSPILVAFLFLMLASCSKESAEEPNPVSFPLQAGIADEASGIADSRTAPGNLWVQQDGGNPAELLLIGHEGKLVKRIALKGLVNRDWEDMTLSNGPDPLKYYIYLGEIGDNAAVYDSYAIYRFPEPEGNADSVTQIDAIRFRYADGAHDAEAFLVEPETLNIYIITKREAKSAIYKISWPYSITSVNTAVKVGELTYNMVVSAAMQPDWKGIVVKDYLNLYYYTRMVGEDLATVLARTPRLLTYQPEQQGEAVCFSIDNKYYFTLSEKVNSNVSLVRYRK